MTIDMGVVTMPAYAPYEPDSVTEPMCCDDPMVHNSYWGRWECASAFFALIDDGVHEEAMDHLDPASLPADMAESWRHWHASWLSDELVWCAAGRAGSQYHKIGEPYSTGTVTIDCGRLIHWVTEGRHVNRGWTGLRNGLPRLTPCGRCWPNGDPDALQP